VTLRSIGATLPGAMPVRNYRPEEFAAAAAVLDQAFDIAWTGDHLLWHYPVVDPIVTLSAVALLTHTVRLGIGILHTPVRSVLPTAKALASLDYLSQGRLIVGVGVGGEMPSEFQAVGVPVSERGVRTDEAIEAFRVLWRDHPATFSGRFISFENAELMPPPAQPDGPPIWIGGRSSAAVRRAARTGDGWLALFLTPERFAERREELEAQTEAGRDVEMAIHLPTCIGGTGAEDRMRGFYGRMASYDADRFSRYWATGSAEQIIDTVGRYVDAGVQHIVLAPPGPEFVPQLEAIATEILPALRSQMMAARKAGAR
jgi:probable F420-dependent oxidoreductase